MGWRERTWPSPSLVIAIVALVVAVGGTAAVSIGKIAGLNKKEKRQVRRIAAKQSNKRIARRAPGLSVASAGSAASASNAAALGGVGASAYVQRSELAPVSPTRLTLSPGWGEVNPGSGTAPATAYRDQLGVVHLSGLLTRASGSESAALTLPPGLRPAYDLEFTAVCDEPGLVFDARPGIVFVYADGRVKPISSGDYSCTERFSLDGIAFRT